MVTASMPRARTPTPVTMAAKWPDKTKKFLARIHAALIIFNDQISSLDECRATAYETFATAYKDAFTDIWPKINSADVTILLQSVKDTELEELHRMSQIMCPIKFQNRNCLTKKLARSFQLFFWTWPRPINIMLTRQEG